MSILGPLCTNCGKPRMNCDCDDDSGFASSSPSKPQGWHCEGSCTCSDAWRCARTRHLPSVACYCACHNYIVTEPNPSSTQLAEKVVTWLSDQKYQDEPLLHAVVCCDHVSRTRFIKSIARILEHDNQLLLPVLIALWKSVKKYDRIGCEGSELLEVMSDAREAITKAYGSDEWMK